MENGSISIHVVIMMAWTAGATFFLVRYLLRKKKKQQVDERLALIEKDGVDFSASEVSMGFDPKMVRKDGRMPCCLITDWTNPDTGETLKLKSQWFWYDPNNEENKSRLHGEPRNVVRFCTPFFSKHHG